MRYLAISRCISVASIIVSQIMHMCITSYVHTHIIGHVQEEGR